MSGNSWHLHIWHWCNESWQWGSNLSISDSSILRICFAAWLKMHWHISMLWHRIQWISRNIRLKFCWLEQIMDGLLPTTCARDLRWNELTFGCCHISWILDTISFLQVYFHTRISKGNMKIKFYYKASYFLQERQSWSRRC